MIILSSNLLNTFTSISYQIPLFFSITQFIYHKKKHTQIKKIKIKITSDACIKKIWAFLFGGTCAPYPYVICLVDWRHRDTRAHLFYLFF